MSSTVVARSQVSTGQALPPPLPTADTVIGATTARRASVTSSSPSVLSSTTTPPGRYENKATSSVKARNRALRRVQNSAAFGGVPAPKDVSPALRRFADKENEVNGSPVPFRRKSISASEAFSRGSSGPLAAKTSAGILSRRASDAGVHLRAREGGGRRTKKQSSSRSKKSRKSDGSRRKVGQADTGVSCVSRSMSTHSAHANKSSHTTHRSRSPCVGRRVFLLGVVAEPDFGRGAALGRRIPPWLATAAR